MIMEIPLNKLGGFICLLIGIIMIAIAIPFYIPLFNFWGFVLFCVGIYVLFFKKHKKSKAPNQPSPLPKD
jgi:hypothetical protein